MTACSESNTENIVVIGGGLMGSSTAWELSRNGEKVLLIEQQDSVYTLGSSFGEARISRVLGVKGEIFSYIQQTSVSETKELINFLNRSLEASHSMDDIYTTSPVTYLHHDLDDDGAVALSENWGVRTEYASTPAAAMEMFGMKLPDFMQVIREYKDYSGTLNPKVLIAKLHKAVLQSGNRIFYNEKVTELVKEGDLYRIRLENKKTGEIREICSRKVVSAAGPYTGRLLKNVAPYFNELITPKRMFLAFFKPSSDAWGRITTEQKQQLHRSYPVADISEEIYYSMIEKYEEDGIPILKVGGHNLRKDIDDLDRVWQKDLEPEEVSWSRDHTLWYLRMLDIPLDTADLVFHHGYSCVYSLTGSEVPYVTFINDGKGNPDPNFIVVGGMSGVGAKGSLAYGLIASNLMLGKTDTSGMYIKTVKALGFERMSGDVKQNKE